MYQIKKDRTTYLNCILAMVILLICALLGPQFLFAIQDNHIQGEIYAGERSQMDMSLLNVGYPKVLRDRLVSFARGRQNGKQYFATATDYVVDMECYDIVDGILDEEWFSFNYDTGIIFRDYKEILKVGYTIEECKRYVIYDEALENGVAFVAWYFDMTISDSTRLKLLTDAEDGTLYQLQIVIQEDEEWVYYGYPDMVYLYTELVNNLVLYWYSYYDAGESGEVSYEYLPENKVYDADKQKAVTNIQKTEVIQAYDSIMIEDKFALIKKALPYRDSQLMWQMQVQRENAVADTIISMGIAELNELVPEFALDK